MTKGLSEHLHDRFFHGSAGRQASHNEDDGGLIPYKWQCNSLVTCLLVFLCGYPTDYLPV